ncbi:MAG: FmdB family zinc ribbon protein [Bacillota bacterium]|nr:FmdB family zinc ribbon protein [Bacillota bacterium]
MPIYEYQCHECGVFEKKQSIKEDPLKVCPTCNGEVKRLISKNVGVIYKGGGFYTTDSRKPTSSCGEGGGCGGGSCPSAS